MTVAYILSSTNSTGGATKSFLAMLKGLKGRGIIPIVVVPDKDDLYSQLLQMDLDVFQTPYRVNAYPWTENLRDFILFLPRLIGRRALNWWSVRKLHRYLKNQNVDLIHTNVSVIDVGFRVAQRLGVPHIYHIREYIDLDFKLKYYPHKDSLQAQLRKEQSYSICITKDIQAHHLQEWKASSKVIYNPIGSTQDELPVTQGEYYLFAGRIEPAKGLIEALEAYNLSGTGIPFYVAGYSPSPNYLSLVQSFIKQHRLEDKVKLLGLRTDTDQLMQHAKALIVSSHFEAFGRCMAEAMFNKCLVIGLDTGGTKEQFDNGRLLCQRDIGFRYQTVEELSDCLKKVENIEESVYNQYVADAFKTVTELYSIEKHIEQVFHFYQAIHNKSIA